MIFKYQFVVFQSFTDAGLTIESSVEMAIAVFNVRYTGHRSANIPCTRSAVALCSGAACNSSRT